MFSVIINPEFDEITQAYTGISEQSNNEQFNNISQVEGYNDIKTI